MIRVKITATEQADLLAIREVSGFRFSEARISWLQISEEELSRGRDETAPLNVRRRRP